MYHGEILPESAASEIELHDVGVVLAATGNDAYNALVCTAFAPTIGRGVVFQLPLDAPPDAANRVTREMRGRIAFESGAHFDELRRRLDQGWVFRKARLSEQYTYENYLADCPPGTLQLLAIKAGGGLSMNAQSTVFAPALGDIVIGFGPAPANSARSALPA